MWRRQCRIEGGFNYSKNIRLRLIKQKKVNSLGRVQSEWNTLQILSIKLYTITCKEWTEISSYQKYKLQVLIYSARVTKVINIHSHDLITGNTRQISTSNTSKVSLNISINQTIRADIYKLNDKNRSSYISFKLTSSDRFNTRQAKLSWKLLQKRQVQNATSAKGTELAAVLYYRNHRPYRNDWYPLLLGNSRTSFKATNAISTMYIIFNYFMLSFFFKSLGKSSIQNSTPEMFNCLSPLTLDLIKFVQCHVC